MSTTKIIARLDVVIDGLFHNPGRHREQIMSLITVQFRFIGGPTARSAWAKGDITRR
jgi:hypothetical protein